MTLPGKRRGEWGRVAAGARIALLGLLTSVPVVRAAERPFRYVARLTDGKLVESDRLINWHDTRAVPQLRDRPLLDENNPFRWLLDRRRRLGERPTAYIEMANGDRLPGVVAEYRRGDENPWLPLPPHFVVRVSVAFEPPENKPSPEIRVLARFVRRIVWQPRAGAAYQPGKALHRDGSLLPFRAVRFRGEAAHVLTADGERRLDFAELGELHLATQDAWSAWYDQLAALCPAKKDRLLSVETVGGLIATASTARFAARFEGNSSDPDRWVHGLGPAWSMDILWVPFREIVCYRSFARDEAPLNCLAPSAVERRGALGGASAVEVDRSVLGTPLASAEQAFGWGLGVSGGTTVRFTLPEEARSLETFVALDRAAGDGGCIQPRISLKAEQLQRQLWEGEQLVGSEKVLNTGELALPAMAGERTLALEIDGVFTGQPAGADPLDIRDHADWGDPLFLLDPAVVERRIAERIGQQFVAWRPWEADASRAELVFLQTEAIPGQFAAAIRTPEGPLVLTREVAVGPGDQWLVIAAARGENAGDDPQIDVRLNGQPAARFSLPRGRASLAEPRPLAVSLAVLQNAASAKATIEIRQLAGKRAAPVEYLGLTIGPQLPTLFPVFEDEAAAAPIDGPNAGSAVIDDRDRYSGARSLRLVPDGRFRLMLAQPIRVRAEPKWGEARFVRFAVRKGGGGRMAIEFEDARPRSVDARYDLGRGAPAYGEATRVWQEDLPDKWIVITRDLYADFGEIDVKSLVVGAPDGDGARLDHVYLARERRDLDVLEAIIKKQ